MAEPMTDKQAEAVAQVDALVRNALKALEEFRELNQEQVDYIVAKASVAARATSPPMWRNPPTSARRRTIL